MDKEVRDASADDYANDGSHLDVDAVFWDEVVARDRLELCNQTFFDAVENGYLQFAFLGETLRIDPAGRSLLRQVDGKWRPSRDRLLTLATVMYLKNVRAVYPLGKDIVGVNELKEGHFFVGPHALRTDALLEKYGDDANGFIRAATSLGGRPMEMADAAVELLPFPRVALYFLLWRADEEFPARIQVLFDRPIENHLAADAIWALVNRVAEALATA